MCPLFWAMLLLFASRVTMTTDDDWRTTLNVHNKEDEDYWMMREGGGTGDIWGEELSDQKAGDSWRAVLSDQKDGGVVEDTWRAVLSKQKAAVAEESEQREGGVVGDSGWAVTSDWGVVPDSEKPATSERAVAEDSRRVENGSMNTEGWRCDCGSTTESHEGAASLECRCEGLGLVAVPQGLSRGLQSLMLTKTGLEILRNDSLKPYKDSIRDLTLTDMTALTEIEAGSFKDLNNLRTITILRTGLEHTPDLSGLGQTSIMHMVDLESNKIRCVESFSVRVKVEQLILNYNVIEFVEGWAFNGSEIAKLSLKGNRVLTSLAHDAFHGLESLRELDLSETAITYLPTGGLYDLEVLRITNTRTLKVIPSVYSFRDLREAWLTYSFHCCAFKFPARHDPRRHTLHQEYLAKIRELCTAEVVTDTGQVRRRRRRGDDDDGDPPYHYDQGFGAISTFNPLLDYEFRDQAADDGEEDHHWSGIGSAPAISGGPMLDSGVFHQTTATVSPLRLHAFCGNLSISSPHVHCTPNPDALNPCEDIMGYNWLRVSVWFVVVTAMVGNMSVLVVLLSTMFEITVPKFLMCHLAFADLCLGAYLLILASMDLHSSGVYFNFAFDWQIGAGCQVAGFLTVFASQLSIFTLTILTLERWFAITYAIYLNRRLKLSRAAQIMAVGWAYSVLMASLPLCGISSYSTTSICLPMDTADVEDVVYLVCLLVVNGLAFVVICVCYAQIYLSLGQETRHCAANGEMTVAKKMALLVFTDFACWAPIAFFGLTAVAGYPLIDVTRSKILLVFFYPLNSCANPYLYAILTAQYRKDLFSLLSRHGLCIKIAQRYKMAYSPPTNMSSPFPLLPRATVNGSFSLASGGNSRSHHDHDPDPYREPGRAHEHCEVLV